MLLDHVIELAADLKPTDPDINLRTLTLTRMLDRVQQLERLLPDLNPEQVIRFEHLYNGSVHDVPPWDGAAKDPDAIREEMRRSIIESGALGEDIIWTNNVPHQRNP